jgi:hypothetical protein
MVPYKVITQPAHTHVPGGHHFILQQPPVESDKEEPQKLFKLLYTKLNACFTSPKHWLKYKVVFP